MHTYFKLFANCIPVNGARRGIICDLQRQQYTFIPNSLYRLIVEDFEKKPIEEVEKEYDSVIIGEYLQFLTENEFGFIGKIEEHKKFPKLSLNWDYPAKISNAIIDIRDITYNFDVIFRQLEELGCKYIQLRFYKQVSISYLETILNLLKESIIKSVQVLLPLGDLVKIDELKKLTYKYNRISSIIVTGADENKFLEREAEDEAFIVFQDRPFNSCNSCGVIIPHRFSPNIQLFTEAQNYNTCLNRKIAIDENGEIKNCPSFAYSYGNIKSVSLLEALEHENFKKCWFVSKDKIEVCKDCEFRYICLDCRVYIENEKNPFSKPEKCNYDPYTATFKN